MKLWILPILSLLFLAKTEKLQALPAPKVVNLVAKESQKSFDLDFGLFEIRGVQAHLSDQWQSLRPPASVSKNQKSRPEIDFIGDDLEKAILARLKENKVSAKSKAAPPKIFIASLEKSNSSRGSRIAQAEIWLDQELAVRASLMESKWSGDPKSWWVAYPSAYNPKTKQWDDLFVVKDKAFKKKILETLRQAYLDRYGDQD